VSKYNNLSIEAYSTGTTRIIDPKQDLLRTQGIQFRTQYPGGLYADASFFVPRPIVDWWELNGATRIVLRNDTRQVYEGYITNFQREVTDGGQGVLVRTIGGWGHILMNWAIRKRWADDRITENVWPIRTGNAEDKFTVDRNSRIQIMPKNVAFTQFDSHNLRYIMPTGETIKRVTFNYNLTTTAAAPTWRLGLYDTIGTAWLDYVDRSTAGTSTGSIDHSLGTARNYIELSLNSFNASPQTPPADGSMFGRFTNIHVYSETGSINMEEIAKDVIGAVTDINSETRFISAAGTPLSLVPFMADNFESAAEIINRAANQGDGAYNRWGAYLIGSERAYVPDGKPLLVLSQYPAMTGAYEYAISLNDLGINLLTPFTISEDYDSIVNWIIIQYNDTLGVQQYWTPDDNAALKDDTSIAAYGRRAGIISIPDSSTPTIAEAIGQRYLAIYKDPQYRLTTPITVRGFIRGKDGMIHSASEIRSSYRLRIEDFASIKIGSGQGLPFVVTQTAYDNDTETCQLTIGIPDAPLLLRFTPMKAPPGFEHGGRQEDGSSIPTGDTGRTITDAMLAKMRTTRAKWAKMTPRQRRALKKKYGL